MYKNATSVGIDIGRTQIRSALIRYDGEVLDNLVFQIENRLNRDQLLDMVIEAVNQTRIKARPHKTNPLCVGIAAKGFIDFKTGLVIGPDQDVEGWNDVPLAKIVSGATSLPCYVDNDANLMAIAEYNFGVAAGYSNIIYVALRSGIGGAIIIDGKLYRGNNNAGGEIGQMSIDLFGPYSSIGIRGSLEYFASSVALVRSYCAMSGKIEPQNESTGVGIRAKEVFELSYRGDPNAMRAIEENALYVGSGLANLISIFSPEIIVLGGGMALARDGYIDLIRENAFKNSIEYCRRDVKIEKATLGYNGSLKGAALFALTRLDGKYI